MERLRAGQVVRAIDDGTFHEVTEADYRAFLKDHPRKEHLRIQSDDRGGYPVWFIYDEDAFATSGMHIKTPSAFKVAYRIRRDGEAMRFWIPTEAVPEDQRRFKD